MVANMDPKLRPSQFAWSIWNARSSLSVPDLQNNHGERAVFFKRD
jgi:hypothetical protein